MKRKILSAVSLAFIALSIILSIINLCYQSVRFYDSFSYALNNGLIDSINVFSTIAMWSMLLLPAVFCIIWALICAMLLYKNRGINLLARISIAKDELMIKRNQNKMEHKEKQLTKMREKIHKMESDK